MARGACPVELGAPQPPPSPSLCCALLQVLLWGRRKEGTRACARPRPCTQGPSCLPPLNGGTPVWTSETDYQSQSFTFLLVFFLFGWLVGWLVFSFSFSFLLAVPHGMWDLPRPGIKPMPPAVEARSLNHWTAREVLFLFVLR